MFVPLRRLLLFIIIDIVPLALHAQVNTASLSGLVTDPSSAIIKGATVSATSSATGITRTTLTDNSGYYAFPGGKVDRTDGNEPLSEAVFAGHEPRLIRALSRELEEARHYRMHAQFNKVLYAAGYELAAAEQKLAGECRAGEQQNGDDDDSPDRGACGDDRYRYGQQDCGDGSYGFDAEAGGRCGDRSYEVHGDAGADRCAHAPDIGDQLRSLL